MYKTNVKAEELGKYLGKGNAIVSVYADFCGTCEMMKPILEKVGKETEILVLKLNVDENQKFVLEKQIAGTPTHFFYKGEKQVERIEGFVPEEKIMEVFK